jgi:hypothetical protein
MNPSGERGSPLSKSFVQQSQSNAYSSAVVAVAYTAK